MISVFDFMTPHEIGGVIAGMSLPGIDARALRSFFSAVQNSGPGRYLIPPYTFKVDPPVLSPGGDPTIFDPRPGLFSLSGVRDVVISADGATIQVLDDRSMYTPYLSAPSGWGGILLKLNRCEKLHILGLKIQAAVVRGLREDGQDLYPKPKLGMELIDFRDGTVGLAPGEGSGINEDIRFNNDILLDVTFIGGFVRRLFCRATRKSGASSMQYRTPHACAGYILPTFVRSLRIAASSRPPHGHVRSELYDVGCRRQYRFCPFPEPASLNRNSFV